MPPQPVVTTEEHPEPQRSGPGHARDALVVAFPEPGVLPVPIPGEVVGRDWFASHDAPDARVSTRHLVFRRAGGKLYLEDAGSRNGTHVNGLRAAGEASISDGAIIRVGRTLLLYRQRFMGDDRPSPPIGRLVGPFGLRRVERDIGAILTGRAETVLIRGETGTGKELVARELAERVRPRGKYTAVNVTALAPSVFESHIFGHRAGAFTGSGSGAKGILLDHEGGTIFLDEIGDLQIDLQSKLLRVVENREVLPVGESTTRRFDVLILAATNRDLEGAVAKERFRRDLLARLETTTVRLPPLRERAEDLFSIARALRSARGKALDAEVEAIERLMLWDWLSNVRELDTLLERAAPLTPTLTIEAVESLLGPLSTRSVPPSALTRELVERTVAETGSEVAAADRLKVTRGTLRRFRATYRKK